MWNTEKVTELNSPCDFVSFGMRTFCCNQQKWKVFQEAFWVCSAEDMKACASAAGFPWPRELHLLALHFPDLHNGADYNCQPHRIVVRIN